LVLLSVSSLSLFIIKFVSSSFFPFISLFSCILFLLPLPSLYYFLSLSCFILFSFLSLFFVCVLFLCCLRITKHPVNSEPCLCYASQTWECEIAPTHRNFSSSQTEFHLTDRNGVT
jgi:hypothetical protein